MKNLQENLATLTILSHVTTSTREPPTCAWIRADIWRQDDATCSIFRTNCAIVCGKRAYTLRGFLRISRGEMASEIPEIFHVFGPQLNAFTSVGILLKYFRRKLLQLEWSKTVSNLGMFCFKLIYIADQVVFRCSFYMSCTFLHFKIHICWSLTAFPWQLDIFRYSRVSGLHSFLAPLVTRLRGICQSIATEKYNKIIASLSFAWIVSNAWCFIKAQ